MLGAVKGRREIFGERVLSLPSIPVSAKSERRNYRDVGYQCPAHDLGSLDSGAAERDRAFSAADLDHGHLLFFDDHARPKAPEKSRADAERVENW